MTLNRGWGGCRSVARKQPLAGWFRMPRVVGTTVAALILLLPGTAQAATGTWSPTGDMLTRHLRGAATRLADGRVLVSAGSPFSGGGAPGATAEIYDPATGTWSATGSLQTSRSSHTSTLLPDGTVLVAAGSRDYSVTSSAELWDPEATTCTGGGKKKSHCTRLGDWSATGFLVIPRASHTATLLPDGRVLAAGGAMVVGGPSAELYDPATGTWSVTGEMLQPRRLGHTATLLSDGQVLATGGQWGNGTAETYDPVSGTWSVTGPMNDNREVHDAAPLPDGRVLVAGGVGPAVGSPCFCRPKLGSAEIFDPSTGEWTPTATMNAVEGAVTAVALLDGRVLVFNGSGAEIFDPTTESWTVAASPPGARTMSTLLADGRVLAAGGGGDAGVAADLFTP